MLQHEQTDPQNALPTVPLPVLNAAEARVTPDELNAALKALEDRQNSTVAIGSVVDELRLNATPEQIWEQVQQQRAQAAAQASSVQAAVVQPAIRPHRRRGRWYVLFAIICVVYGFSHNGYVAMHGGEAQAPFDSTQTITISGDSQTETLSVQGKDVVITGDNDKITLHGKARSITVNGDDNAIIADTADAALVSGDGDTMKWTGTPPPDLSDPSHRQHFPSTGTP